MKKILEGKNIKLGNSFFKSVMILASGSLLAQIINFLFAPVLTRLFSPEEIGTYTYVLSFMFLFLPIINGRYDMSIVTEEKEPQVFALIKLSFFLCIILSFVASLGFALYVYYFSNHISIPLYISFIMFLLLFTGGVINILTSYNNRKKDYKLMSSLFIIRTASQNFGATLGGILNFGILGLLIPYLLGQILGIKKQAKLLWYRKKDIKKIKFDVVMSVMKLHYKQPIYSAPAIFANNFSYSSLTFFIGALFGMGIVGFYSISVRVLGLPLALLSGNVSRVFFENASREFEETGQFYSSFKKATFLLISLAIPMVMAMNFIVPSLATLIFGNEWSDAGIYIKILSLMFGIRFVVSSLTPGLLVANKQNYELLLQILFVLSSIVTFLIVKHMELTIYNFLMIINYLFSGVYIFYFIVIYHFSKSTNK